MHSSLRTLTCGVRWKTPAELHLMVHQGHELSEERERGQTQGCGGDSSRDTGSRTGLLWPSLWDSPDLSVGTS